MYNVIYLGVTMGSAAVFITEWWERGEGGEGVKEKGEEEKEKWGDIAEGRVGQGGGKGICLQKAYFSI